MIYGIVDHASLGVHAYARRLQQALGNNEYQLAERRRRGHRHLHLANSSRKVLFSVSKDPFITTVHDVLPRDPRLMLLYKTVVYRQCVEKASAVIVHSDFAAQSLLQHSNVDPAKVHVVLHPANTITRQTELSLPVEPDTPLFVVPGVLKDAKCVKEICLACKPLIADGHMQLLFAGAVAQPEYRQIIESSGAMLIENPDDAVYQTAIVEADVVVCLRKDSVGESNGPLLDGIGTGKPLLASASGSIPQTAKQAAIYVDGYDIPSIKQGFQHLLDEKTRKTLAEHSKRRGQQISWDQSAVQHQQIFQSVWT